MTQQDFINTVGEMARSDMKVSGILASLTCAQAILESGWGTSELAVNANALFGIKVNSWQGKTYQKKTQEYVNGQYVTVVADFRAYENWEQSIKDHSEYLTTRKLADGSLRYVKVINEKDYVKACQEIQKAGYATDPNYSKKLINLIVQYKLGRFDNVEVSNKMKKVYLDAGHGINTAGKRTPDGIREWSLNNKVCVYIAEYLKGYDVQVIRTDDTSGKTDVALATRINTALNGNADVLVSIHHNALSGTWGNHTGTEVWTDIENKTADDVKLANAIVNKLSQYTGLKNRGVKAQNWLVINTKKIPAVLCEGGFMDSSIDYPIITSEDGQRAYAKAVAEGVVEFLGLTAGNGGSIATPTHPEEKLTGYVEIIYRGADGVNLHSKPTFDGYVCGVAMKGAIHEVVAKVKVGSYYMYKLKSGAYITASKEFVTFRNTMYETSIDASQLKVGDAIMIKSSATHYATGETIKGYYKNVRYHIQQVKSDRVLVKELYSWVLIKDIILL